MNEEKIVQGKPKKQYDKEFSRQRRKQWKQAAQRLSFKTYGALLDHIVDEIEKKKTSSRIVLYMLPQNWEYKEYKESK